MLKQPCWAGKNGHRQNLMLEIQQEQSKILIFQKFHRNYIYFFFAFIPSERMSALVCCRDPQTQRCKQSCAPTSPANGGQGEVTLNRSLLWLGSNPSVASVETSIIPAGEVIDYKTQRTKTIERNWITSVLEVKQCGRTKLAEDHWADPPFS